LRLDEEQGGGSPDEHLPNTKGIILIFIIMIIIMKLSHTQSYEDIFRILKAGAHQSSTSFSQRKRAETNLI